jgi:hypothetical protein
MRGLTQGAYEICGSGGDRSRAEAGECQPRTDRAQGLRSAGLCRTLSAPEQKNELLPGWAVEAAKKLNSKNWKQIKKELLENQAD